MNDVVAVLLGVAAIWGVAVVTPGPNFFLVAHQGASQSRRAAAMAVLGIVLGTVLWGLAYFFGITLLFAVAPWAFGLLKLLGAAYLCYLGVRLLWRAGQRSSPIRHSSAPRRVFWTGLLTNLTNPKTALFVMSLFATVLPERPGWVLGVSSVIVMAGISLLWYGAVALLLSSHRVMHAYRNARLAIERVAGAVFIGFGVHLALGRHGAGD
ncbi:MAG: LysE family translocator [Gammaproteobacteria bacterium]|nr:LysE family translocator [Gammaproteobacteria bacterium]